MPHHQRMRLTLALAGTLCLSFSAQADIGGIGLPVVPSNGISPSNNSQPHASAVAPQSKQAGAPAENRPLLIIRFKQATTYYERSLQQAVTMSQRVNPNAVYTVVLVLPTAHNSREADHNQASGEHNLEKVVQAMQQMGVAPQRIHTTTESSMEPYQVIRISVQ